MEIGGRGAVRVPFGWKPLDWRKEGAIASVDTGSETVSVKRKRKVSKERQRNDAIVRRQQTEDARIHHEEELHREQCRG
jgi:hypothetical protein